MAARIRTYAEFWPYYLAEHSKRATRTLHFIGTGLIPVVVAFAAWTGEWWALVLLLPALYGFAWAGHFLVEGNRPATFTHPLWSLVSDFRMSALALTGRLAGEYEKYQIRTRD